MKRSYLIYLCSLIFALTFVSCGKKDVPQEVLRPVRYTQVAMMGSEIEKSFSGTASAGVKSNLSFKVSGTLTKRLVKVGDRVKKGELIAELDAADYVIQEKEMKASFAQAQAKVRNSKANYDRIKALYENDNVSKSDLDAARATLDSDKAGLSALQQKLDLAGRKTEYTRLTAPIDGVVGEVLAEVNENVNSGQTIVSIESEGDIKVIVGVPESFISVIKTGSSVSVSFPSLKSKIFNGIVTEVSYSIAGASTYPVSVVLDNPSDDVRPGMAANITFKIANKKSGEKSISVPASSVAEDSKGKFVFVLKNVGEGVGTVHRRSIETYGLTNQGFEIKSGLNDGELVVTAGVSKLSDEMKVKFIQ